MNCKTTVGLLSAYLDRELANGERDAVRAHLADCDRCRAEERDLRALKGLLLGVRAPEPADDFERRLMMGLREEMTRPVRPRFALPPIRPLALGQFGGLAAAAALATIVIVRTPERTEPRIVRVESSSASHGDYNSYADNDTAFSQGDGFTAGTVALTTYGP